MTIFLILLVRILQRLHATFCSIATIILLSVVSTFACNDPGREITDRQKRLSKQAPQPLTENEDPRNQPEDNQVQGVNSAENSTTTENQTPPMDTQEQTNNPRNNSPQQTHEKVAPSAIQVEPNETTTTQTSTTSPTDAGSAVEWQKSRDRSLIPINKIPFATTASLLSTRTHADVCRVWKEYRAPKYFTAANKASPADKCLATPVSNGQIWDAVNLTNAFRWLIGVAPIGYNATLDQNAHECATMMSAAWKLNHHPPEDWPCYTKGGATAAAASNENLSMRSDTGNAIKAYIDDRNVASLGHRIWIFARHLKNISMGQVGNANCTTVIGNTDSQQASEIVVAYPSPGFFPKEALYSRWSISLQDISLHMSEAIYSGDVFSRKVVTPAKALSSYKITNLSNNTTTEGEPIRHTEYGGSKAMIIEFAPATGDFAIESGSDYKIELRDFKMGSNVDLGSDYTVSPGSGDGLKNISYITKLTDC